MTTDPHAQAIDDYARVRLRRTQDAILTAGGLATRAQMETLRECYAHLNRDTPRKCWRRLHAIREGT